MAYDPTNTDRFSELLSAYLDGELTADEQALVEQRLAENAEFRQLHDELRALRSGLESLPRYRLKEDLAASVLRRAERAMLSAPAVVSSANVAPESKQVTLAESVPVSERALRGLRAFRWSIVALAVALLIMVFNPGKDKDGREVALETKQNAQSDVQVEDAAAPPADLAMQAKESSAEALEAREGQSLRKSAQGEGAAVSAPALTAKRALAPGENRASEANAKQRDRADDADKLAEEFGADGRGLAQDAVPAPGVAAPMRAEVLVEPRGAAVSRFSESIDAKAGPAGQRLREGAVGGQFGTGADGVLVVQCDISPEAARSGAFAQLLAEQQIALVDGKSLERMNRRSKAANDPTAADVAGAAASEAAEPASAPAAEPAGTTGEAKDDAADKQAASRRLVIEGKEMEADRAADGWADAPPLDAVLVEASPEQIAATFAGLQSRTDEFYSLNFQPPQSSVPVEKAQKQHKATDALTADGVLPVEATAGPDEKNQEQAAEESKVDREETGKPADGVTLDDSAAEKSESGKLEAGAGKKKVRSFGLKGAIDRAVPAEMQLDEASGFGGSGDANFAAGGGGLGGVEDFSAAATAQRVPINEEQFRQLAPQARPLAKGAIATELPEAEAPAAIQSQQRQLGELAKPKVSAARTAAPAAAPVAAPVAADAVVPAPTEQAVESLADVPAAPRDAQAGAAAPPMRVLFLFRVVPAKPASR